MTLWKWLIIFGIVKPKAYEWTQAQGNQAHVMLALTRRANGAK